MNNEQLLQMYDAIRQQPDLLVKAAARKRLINFARYMQPDLVLEPFTGGGFNTSFIIRCWICSHTAKYER